MDVDAASTGEKPTGKTSNEDEGDSDVEMDGIDLEGDNDEQGDEGDDAGMEVDSSGAEKAENGEEQENLEAEELEEARRERRELLASEQDEKKQTLEESTSVNMDSKLNYLVQQSDVFAHFLAGTVAAGDNKKKKGASSSSGRGTKSGRLTEAEEDARMLKSANSRRRIIRVEKQPTILAKTCKMHEYQIEGLNWLIKLHDHGINGILADEMGLGKTLQTIALLAYLRESRGVRGPHIVVVPKSVVGNWIREFKMWCPVIRAVKMGGTKEEREAFIKNELSADPNSKRHKFDVVVTSYEGMLKEKGKFSKISWNYVIIDEAHRIKNEQSSLSKAVRMMSTQFRLLITGTPLQNNLRELWALLNFLLPEVFGDADQFDEWFSLSDESGKENVIKKLHTVLRPFMLRRVKKDVAKALPPKTETKLFIGLTKMQQEWYVRCLQKDAHELNKLGGPDRNRLMNVLMQLRKVCNHPYLFDGAEPGPPFFDGPHLWENCGKTQLLNKLLPKLKSRDSRVLIFCQMTRVLDILEDYMRYVGFEYCRIDGSTDGLKRDRQVDEFNAEGSTKFCFLLSTRAGGLGLNLATADTVILYDSDWNPQVDLQAMDRAHRIGQTKPVKVFRFVTEGTVEEKIIERADRKLFLDAAVIQQGRLAEQNKTLEKGDLMKMVRFGADEILSGKGGTYTDEDIDALIAKGEERTSQLQAKLQTDAKHNLANFSLLADDDTGRDTFSFDGKNYREVDKNTGNFINLPQRQRKRTYTEVGAPEKGSSGAKTQIEASTKRKKKGPALHDFQLFNMERLNALIEKERSLSSKREWHTKRIDELNARAKSAPPRGPGDTAVGHFREEFLRQASEIAASLDTLKLSQQEELEKKTLLAEGFPDWSRKDFKSFCTALERYGRYDFHRISSDVINETGKELSEVQRYFVAFFTNYTRIHDWQKIMDRVEKGEKKILRLRQIRDAIQEKVERHLEDTFGEHYGENAGEGKQLPSVAELIHHSWSKMKINYGSGTRGRGYQEEEDAFLVCMMYRHGFGAAERIRMEIRRAWQFRFNWYFKSRSALEIQKRCDILVRIIERENSEIHQKEEELLKGHEPEQHDTGGAKPAPRTPATPAET
ncbi:hypothetical protein ACA910_002597 [Epithemia clementina (nom. ined.)]